MNITCKECGHFLAIHLVAGAWKKCSAPGCKCKLSVGGCAPCAEAARKRAEAKREKKR